MKSLARILGLVAVLGVTCSVPSHAAVFPEPIARAARGQLQCYGPDESRKTCAALVAFKADGNGRFHGRVTVLVSPSPTIVMKGNAIVTPKAGELCGTLQQQNFDAVTFSDGVNELEPMQSSFMRALLAASAQGYFDREVCGAFVPNGKSLVVKPKMDGAPIDAELLPVIWVNPEENYRVAP